MSENLLARFRVVVPEPRPPMTERLLAALVRLAQLDSYYPDRVELLWMSVGLKPASSYSAGEWTLRSGHWTEGDPLTTRQEKIRHYRALELVDEFDAALLEAGWVTGRQLPTDPTTPLSGWNTCTLCREQQPFSTLLCATGSHNVVAASTPALERLLTAIGAPYDERRFGEALGYPTASIEEFVRLGARKGKTDAEKERLNADRDALIAAVPLELRPYSGFIIVAPADLPLLEEARRRIATLFGELPSTGG